MSKMLVTVEIEMSGASGGQRDRAVVVALRAPNESWVHSVVVCIRRQVALFAHVRSSIADKNGCIYLARSPMSQWSADVQWVALLEVSFQ